MTDSTITITPLPLLWDNYAWIIRNGAEAAVVDPGEAGPIELFLQRNNLRLTALLVTHHHGDHCGGVAELKKRHHCPAIGGGDRRMPFIDDCVHDNDTRRIAGADMTSLATPGHTLTHFTYFFPGLRALFTGDTLFGAGCGRLFETGPSPMLDSLNTCAAVGGDVLVYCGHEYTEENLRFAQIVEPGNAAVRTRYREVKVLLRKGLPTVPSRMDLEKETNPFLRVTHPTIRKQLHLDDATDAEVFAELRKRKDGF
jgi:hydroxyacylglutathione hydrolase